MAERTSGIPCPEFALYDSVVPLCRRHLRAVGEWYVGRGILALQDRLRPEGTCEYPASYCSHRVSHLNPQFAMCQEHLAMIWSAVQSRQDVLRAREAAKHEQDEAAQQARMEDARASAAARRAADPGVIYYLRVGSEYKIGWTKNLYNRLRQYPPTAELLAVQPGSRRDELALHRRFAIYRVGGREWYRRASVISRHIRSVAETHGAHDPRDPIELNKKTPQERQAESMRWIGRGNGPAA